MKTRMHRFWLSISLAAGSLAMPLSSKLWSHDLPTRWASNAQSTSSWNYLLDDCLGSRDSIASSDHTNLANSQAPIQNSILPKMLDFDAALSKNSLARFTSEIACWASQWERLQQQAERAGRAALVSHTRPAKNLIAARPDFGFPPAPPVQLADSVYVDTCNFEAEYEATQLASELLSSARAQAAKEAAAEAELARAIAAADEIAAAAIDSIPQASEEPSVCGGEQCEDACHGLPSTRFAPSIVDEYLAYDIDARDSHWIGGLGKAWQLKAALSARAEITDSEGALAAESLGDDNNADLPAVAQAADSAVTSPLAAQLAAALEWLDETSCVVAGEMYGMEHAALLGEQLGRIAFAGAHHSMTQYVAMGAYLDMPPAFDNPSLEAILAAADSDAWAMTVEYLPDRADSRPERDASLDAASESASGAAATASIDVLPKIDFAQLRREVLSLAAAKLDSLGMTCLKTANRLSNWAEPQIASRDESDIR